MTKLLRLPQRKRDNYGLERGDSKLISKRRNGNATTATLTTSELPNNAQPSTLSLSLFAFCFDRPIRSFRGGSCCSVWAWEREVCERTYPISRKTLPTFIYPCVCPIYTRNPLGRHALSYAISLSIHILPHCGESKAVMPRVALVQSGSSLSCYSRTRVPDDEMMQDLHSFRGARVYNSGYLNFGWVVGIGIGIMLSQCGWKTRTCGFGDAEENIRKTPTQLFLLRYFLRFTVTLNIVAQETAATAASSLKHTCRGLASQQEL